MRENSLGERLKQTRIEKKLTQREVAGEFITRNMLSQIENGLATPSIKTIEYLAKTLNKPIAYFMETLVDAPMSCNDVADIDEALTLFENRDYSECKNTVDKLIENLDEKNMPANLRELYYLAWKCNIELGAELFLDKNYAEAKKLLTDSSLYEEKTPYCDLNTKMNKLLLLAKLCIYLEQTDEAKTYLNEYEKLSDELSFLNDSIFV